MNILIAGLLMKIEEDHVKILNLSCVTLVGGYFCIILLCQDFLYSHKIPVFRIEPFFDALKNLALEIPSLWIEFPIDLKTSIDIFLEPHLQCGLILSFIQERKVNL